MDALWSALAFAVLCGAAALGHVVHGRLRARHRTPENLDYARFVTGLLVTFTALVLGLLTASVSASFEKTSADLRSFAAAIIQLSASMEDYGPATRPMRADLRSYTASAIASTWPEESPPSGRYPKAVDEESDFDAANLQALLHRVEGGLVALGEADPVLKLVKAKCVSQIDAIENQRWVLIGEAHSAITPLFYDVLLLWLFVIFLSFGLTAPRNAFARTAVVLVAFCVSAALFVLLELDGPLDGVIKVPSEPMWHALRHLDASLQDRPTP